MFVQLPTWHSKNNIEIYYYKEMGILSNNKVVMVTSGNMSTYIFSDHWFI